MYRFYHGSLKVYGIQELTGRLVDALQTLLPGRPLDADFEQIIREGTGHVFALEHNQEWLLHTRPMLEAFWHAHYMVAMAVKYGPASRPPGARIAFGLGRSAHPVRAAITMRSRPEALPCAS